MKTLIVIVGPTAVGKTEAAIRLAERVGGEIVSADSRQVYRHMDIGTAKPSARQRTRVPHHLIDVVDPDEAFSLAQYQTAAHAAIDDIFRRGRQPLLVGGTGLYVKAVTEGLRIPAVPPNPELRAELETRAAQEGKLALHDELRRVDPAAAARIDPRNVRRTIRALEVYRLSGRRFSEPGIVRPPPYPIITIGLTMPRPDLYRRIDARVGEMIAAGLIEETRQLALQYDWSLPALSGLGYRQIGRFVRGECSLEDAIAAIKRDTRGFVRRQYNWFRLTDPRIRWLDARLEIDRDLLTIVRPERAAVK
ncbi:MAG TPA: tRNA (adenosine(37)-N6)-dimethylallyltransferase MiaA [Anaerolineae bacterium]|nr:tRNA (adenosine(37)-N6)-dimethylallyltransferase MiaA [Anaerolineae bacterium]